MADTMTKARMQLAIRVAHNEITRLVERHQGHDAYRNWERALSESERVEREHRAFGRRFTGRTNMYRLSVDECARMFNAKHVLEHLDSLRPSKPTSMSAIEACGYKRDVLLCMAVAEALLQQASKAELAAIPRSVLDIDYAKDVAR